MIITLVSAPQGLLFYLVVFSPPCYSDLVQIPTLVRVLTLVLHGDAAPYAAVSSRCRWWTTRVAEEAFAAPFATLLRSLSDYDVMTARDVISVTGVSDPELIPALHAVEAAFAESCRSSPGLPPIYLAATSVFAAELLRAIAPPRNAGPAIVDPLLSVAIAALPTARGSVRVVSHLSLALAGEALTSAANVIPRHGVPSSLLVALAAARSSGVVKRGPELNSTPGAELLESGGAAVKRVLQGTADDIFCENMSLQALRLFADEAAWQHMYW